MLHMVIHKICFGATDHSHTTRESKSGWQKVTEKLVSDSGRTSKCRSHITSKNIEHIRVNRLVEPNLSN